MYMIYNDGLEEKFEAGSKGMGKDIKQRKTRVTRIGPVEHRSSNHMCSKLRRSDLIHGNRQRYRT